jgi:PAS domain S-box-containing protein
MCPETKDTAPALDLASILANQPEVLRRFLDSMGDALFVVDAKQNVVFWNRQAEKLTGYTGDEVVGRHCLSGIRCERCLAKCNVFAQGEIENARITLKSKEGKTLFVSKNAFVLRNEDGVVVGGIEMLQDETELTERIGECTFRREQVEERERLQAAILGSVREGVLTIDKDWRITSFSRRAEELTGFEGDEAIGKFCHEVIGYKLCKQDCPALHCLQTDAEEAERVTRILAAGGRPMAVTEVAAPLKDGRGEAIGSLLLIEDRSRLAGFSDEEEDRFAGMIGVSAPMRRVFDMIERVGPRGSTVLLTGESGVGKEMAARAIHKVSPRADGPFQAINCGALPASLLESELFGHVKGAFTGAVADRAGRIEAAENGTLFLDELGEMEPVLQVKLLRFLQEREYQRVGETDLRHADVRIIAATNRDLTQAVAQGMFREDLYYRIKVIPIELPPLRERSEDLPLLAVKLLAKIAAERDRPGLILTPAAIGRLREHNWPGNVRELINVREYAAALSPSRRIRPEDLPPELAGGAGRYSASEEQPKEEETKIREALERHGGNKTKTAQYLGMNRVTLYRKLRKYGLG